MPAITTQKQAQAAVRACRHFCYLCGKPFEPTDDKNSDHVPNKRLFREEDRANFSLALDTHVQCNGDHSSDDNTITQLIGILHDQNIYEHLGGHLLVEVLSMPDGTPVAAAFNLPIQRIIRRWIQAFHAALYAEYLPERSPNPDYAMITVHPPLAEGRRANDGVIVALPTPPQVATLVEEVKWNRAQGLTDKILSQHGQCHYEGTWVVTDDGQYACFWGLQLYDWKVLGAEAQGQRGCVGFYYFADGHKPAAATLGSKSPNLLTSGHPLDPFS